jgi:hypothetical protein
MIQSRSRIRTFHGVLILLSIVGSLFAFQDFASSADERAESVKTEWVASGRITKKAVSFGVAGRCEARAISLPDHLFAELNFSRRIKARISVPPPRITRYVVRPQKTVAGLPEEDLLFSLG